MYTVFKMGLSEGFWGDLKGSVANGNKFWGEWLESFFTAEFVKDWFDNFLRVLGALCV